MSPVLMEALQLLKFMLKKEHLNFVSGWATPEVAMCEVSDTGCDPLGALFKGDSNAVMDDILVSFDAYD